MAHADRILSKALFLLNDQDERVASGFVVTVPLGKSADIELCHAYVVTALHCVLRDSGAITRLRAEFAWMDQQGSVRQPLSIEAWHYFRTEDLLDTGEDWVDLAVHPVEGGFSGIVIGRALEAVPLESVTNQLDVGWSLSVPLGAETQTVGLLPYYSGDGQEIEPVLRFGRLAAVPRKPVRGARGLMRGYLVESMANSGMSGAPVFAEGNKKEPRLIGVHVGHVPNSSTASSAGHEGVAVVAPAYKLRELLNAHDLVAHRAAVESSFSASPWRFRDRRHRERHGVVLAEEPYFDYEEYEQDYPFCSRFLLLQPTSRPSVTDFWNEAAVKVLGNLGVVQGTLAQELQGCRYWRRDSPRRVAGWGKLSGRQIHLDLYLDERDDVEALFVSFGDGLDATVADVRGLAHALGSGVVDVSRDSFTP